MLLRYVSNVTVRTSDCRVKTTSLVDNKLKSVLTKRRLSFLYVSLSSACRRVVFLRFLAVLRHITIFPSSTLTAFCSFKRISWHVLVCYCDSFSLMASLLVPLTIIVVKNRITFKTLKFYPFRLSFAPRISKHNQANIMPEDNLWIKHGFHISASRRFSAIKWQPCWHAEIN